MDKGYSVVTPGQRPKPLNVVGTDVTILTSASETGSYGITFQKGDEGTGPPPHSHDWDEAFYVTSGTVNFQCGDDHHSCAAGTLVHVPRNTVHAFNYAKGGGTMLEITSRDSTSSEMFTAFDAEIDAETDFSTVLSVLKKNGVTVAS